MPVIEVINLTKAFRTYKKQPGFAGAVKGLFHRQYEQTVAVNEVGFKIEPGELVGFLGPNGAGKTTTLKMLAGLLYPTSGTAKVLGYTPWERADGYRRQFALLLGQKNQLWWDLPARESLDLNAKIYGIPRDSFERTVAEMTELLAVKDNLNVMVRELSLGEGQGIEARDRERLKTELRAESFNITNTPAFTNPDNNKGNATFGQIQGTRQSSERQLQMAVRFLF